MTVVSKQLKLRVMHLVVFASVMFVTTVLITYTVLSNDKCLCGNVEKEIPNTSQYASNHKLAVLVPFRDRFTELLIFVPHMKKFLEKQNINYHIFVLNQVDSYRFNRASLINVGYLYTKDTYDYIAMHDIDLLPLNPQLKYGYPSQPFHIAAPELHPKYHYPTFVGGILLINGEQFVSANGMSNKYWGWGLEDDEFYVRLKELQLNVSRPTNIGTNSTNTFRHIHDKNLRKRDVAKCYNQREVSRRRDYQTGLHSIRYKIVDINNLTIDTSSVTVLNIELTCDQNLTPWCTCVNATTEKVIKKTTPKKMNSKTAKFI